MLFKVDENLPVEVSCTTSRRRSRRSVCHRSKNVRCDRSDVGVRLSRRRSSFVTLDLDFSDIRTYPPADYPGLIVLRPRSQSKPAVVSLVNRLLTLLATESLQGNLWILQDTGLRIREGRPSDESD